MAPAPRPDPTSTTLTDRFADIAGTAVRKLPLYRRLCEGAAADPEVADRLSLAPDPQQRVPTLLLAAVHDVLLAGLEDPLADWYSSVQPASGRVDGQPRRVGEGPDDPWPHFRRLALEDDGVADRLRTRSTQTNEIGRCAALLPAFTSLAAGAPGAPPDGGRPLGLVEVGASAGLNLLFDRYHYSYRGEGRRSSADVEGRPIGQVGGSSPVDLVCRVRGPVLPPFADGPPPVASRVGLDRAPIDISDPEAARWLVACQWPDQPERIHRARRAIALAHADPPRLLTGDAVDDVSELVAAVPVHALPVVYATWVLAYLPVQRQRDLLAVLDAAGAERDLSLVFAEQPALVPGLGVPRRPDTGPDDRETDATALVRVDWRDGERTAARLADMHPHATWLEWLAR